MPKVDCSEEHLYQVLQARLVHLQALRKFIDAQISKTTVLIQGLDEARNGRISLELAGVLNMPIEFDDMSIRLYNALLNRNLKTVGDVVRQRESDLLKTKNFGRKSLSELKRWLDTRGLQLGMLR